MAEHSLYSVRCYYNTGFNAINRPADVSVLANAEYQQFPSNYLRQNLDLISTRVKASWQEVKECDYVRIGNAYYLVNSITMLSPETAELWLEEDPILSMGGIAAIQGVTGWVERAHVSSSDDALFANTMAEPWTPSQPLKIDTPEEIGISTTGERVNIVQSTVKLDEIAHYAQVYKTETGDDAQSAFGSVTVPLIPKATNRCIFGIYGNFGYKQYTYPHSSFYFADNQVVSNGINDIRSLGIETAILTAYQIPRALVTTMGNPASSNVITTLTNTTSRRSPSDSLLYRYGSYTPKNSKVYQLYNLYHITSTCSGDSAEWMAEDIYDGASDKPEFLEYADLSPEGKPFIQPVYFHGATTAMYQEAVQGETWLRVPLSWSQASGSLIASNAFGRSLQREKAEFWVTAGTTAYSAAKSMAGPVQTNVQLGNQMGPLTEAQMRQYNQGGSAGFPGALETIAAGGIAAQRQYARVLEDHINYINSNAVVEPGLFFAVDYGAQGYVGNSFFIWRTRLSEQDMERADNFLTQFGYAQDKRLELSDLTNRRYFNFIKAREVTLLVDAPLRMRQHAEAVISNGVRLWHVLPNPEAMTNNP